MNERLYPQRSLRLPARPSALAKCLEALHAVPGWDAYRDGRLDAAGEVLEQELLLHPENGRAWELLGLVRRDMAKTLAAVDAFEKASLLVVIQSLSRVCMAECYAVLRRIDLARDLYLMQAELSEDSPEMLLIVASGLEGLGDPRSALALARKSASLDPESGQAAYDMCYYSMRCGCPASLAESLAWRAVELEPDNIHFRIGLASLLVRLNHCERACHVLRNLEHHQFEAVCCPCCLERIAELYRLAGDQQRRLACLHRLKILSQGLGDTGQVDDRSTRA